jgi:hypothetical protein
MSSVIPRIGIVAVACWANTRISGECQDDIDRGLGQLDGGFRPLLIAQSKSARIDRQILTLDEAVVPKLVQNCDSPRLTAW